MAKKTTITITEDEFLKATAKVTDTVMSKKGAGASVMLMTMLIGALLDEELFGEDEKTKPKETPEVDAETLLMNRVNGNETPLD